MDRRTFIAGIGIVVAGCAGSDPDTGAENGTSIETAGDDDTLLDAGVGELLPSESPPVLVPDEFDGEWRVGLYEIGENSGGTKEFVNLETEMRVRAEVGLADSVAQADSGHQRDRDDAEELANSSEYVTVEAVGIASDAFISASPYQNSVLFRDANVTAELRHGYLERVEDIEDRDEISSGALEYAAAWHRTWRE